MIIIQPQSITTITTETSEVPLSPIAIAATKQEPLMLLIQLILSS